MARPKSGRPWLLLRGGRWYIAWYDDDARQTRRISLRTSDKEQAESMLAKFVPPSTQKLQPEGSRRAWAVKMCRRARENAKAKGRLYSISPELVCELFEQQGGRCAVTGMSFDYAETYRNPFAPSLDQITPGAGYTPDNIRIVTVIANTAMNGWGEAALRRMIINSRLPGSITEDLLRSCLPTKSADSGHAH